ncbi:MAG: formyltetrahydrofolate deformylase [Bacilli bacterium]
MNQQESLTQARILIACPDQPGVVSAVAGALYGLGANITESAQHTTDPSGGAFFMRIACYIPASRDLEAQLFDVFQPLVNRFAIHYELSLGQRRQRMAIFVSREDHCLVELLWQRQSGGLTADIAMVISNHETQRATVEQFGIPFHCTPVTPDSKDAAENLQLQLLDGSADFLVLARYMQVLSPRMIAAFPNRIINIHHSFLPAFSGAKPYERAYTRGVKIIGATAHYVTEELDAGPIIEQDVLRINHGYTAADMKRAGRQVERTVLARAVQWHTEDRILVHANKTIVFL